MARTSSLLRRNLTLLNLKDQKVRYLRIDIRGLLEEAFLLFFDVQAEKDRTHHGPVRKTSTTQAALLRATNWLPQLLFDQEQRIEHHLVYNRDSEGFSSISSVVNSTCTRSGAKRIPSSYTYFEIMVPSKHLTHVLNRFLI